MYPLDKEYIPHIQGFIDRLSAHSELKVRVNPMSTQVYGELGRIFEIVAREIEASFDHTRASFVMKVIKDDVSESLS